MKAIQLALYLAPIMPLYMFADTVADSVLSNGSAHVEVLRAVAKEGFLAILAVGLLLLYRMDRRDSETRLAKVAQSYNEAMEMLAKSQEMIASRLHDLTLMTSVVRRSASKHANKKSPRSK